MVLFNNDPKTYEMVIHFRSKDGRVHQSFLFPLIGDLDLSATPIMPNTPQFPLTSEQPTSLGTKLQIGFEALKGGDRKNEAVEYLVYDWTRDGMTPEAMGVYMSLNKLLLPFDRQHLYEVAKAHIRNEDQERKHLINDFGEDVLIQLLREKGYTVTGQDPEDEEPVVGYGPSDEDDYTTNE